MNELIGPVDQFKKVAISIRDLSQGYMSHRIDSASLLTQIGEISRSNVQNHNKDILYLCAVLGLQAKSDPNVNNQGFVMIQNEFDRITNLTKPDLPEFPAYEPEDDRQFLISIAERLIIRYNLSLPLDYGLFMTSSMELFDNLRGFYQQAQNDPNLPLMLNELAECLLLDSIRTSNNQSLSQRYMSNAEEAFNLASDRIKFHLPEIPESSKPFEFLDDRQHLDILVKALSRYLS